MENQIHQNFSWVKDLDGNTFICSKDQLIDPSKLSAEEKKSYCIDESSIPAWAD